ncbi:MAG: histidine kinase [Actinobacteria bacterium 13_1_20CM_3_71_11]|nr:MAG: histidine kinase [Actinobacteria bacterium 13_1_20CM_3_71_11]
MILVGTSGWQYKDWRERFYPAGTPLARWLEHYAENFATVEVNNAFYRLPERGTFVAWRHRTPRDFRVAVKMSRYLTHIKRLRDPAEPVERFLNRAYGLGDKLGPVLLQLPPTLRFDLDALDDVLARFPSEVKVAVEPRHASWWVPETRDLLEKYQAALCWSDRLGRPVAPTWRTAGFGYLRLHEGRARPRPRYGTAALRSWVNRIAECYDDEPVYVYFNNDPGGAAIADASAFAGLARRRGLTVSRTP